MINPVNLWYEISQATVGNCIANGIANDTS